MQNTTTSVRYVAWAIVMMAFASTAAGALTATAPSTETEATHPETDCGDNTPPVSVGQQRGGSLDPAVDTEDAVPLSPAAGWQERGVVIDVEVGKESTSVSYALRIETFSNTDCAGAALTSQTAGYGDRVTVEFTPGHGAAHGIRFRVEQYSGAAFVQDDDKARDEGHCFPHCVMDWWFEYALGHSV